jgi:hypothetical protein
LKLFQCIVGLDITHTLEHTQEHQAVDKVAPPEYALLTEENTETFENFPSTSLDKKKDHNMVQNRQSLVKVRSKPSR